MSTQRIDPVTLEWLFDARPDARERLTRPSLKQAVASVSVTSRALTRVLITDPAALDVLDALDDRPKKPDDPGELAAWTKRELLRIAARDLCHFDDVEAVGANLARLGDDVLETALASVGDGGAQLAIVGMGKLGGFELNYASDVDVMFVGECDPAVARAVLDVARTAFRVDPDLRPEGRSGPLVRSIASYKAYWERWASPWEFQALLKARGVVGPQSVLDDWEIAANEALWQQPFGTDEIRYVREMKARSESIVEKKGLSRHEVKRGRGGIRDVEFAVQLLQLVHGRRDPGVRSKSTLGALRQLVNGDYIAQDDADALSDSYRFLRNVEHRLQLNELEQTHTVPKDNTVRAHLSSSLGMELDTFDKALREHQTTVRQAHERLYFRPLLESFGEHEALDSETLEERVTALGFTDATRIRAAIAELTKGMTRRSRLMHQMMPLLLDWLSESPEPDQGLLGLRTLMSWFGNSNRIVAAFRDSPEVARRLCILLGTSQNFAQAIIRNPALLDDVAKDGPSDGRSWHQQLDDALDWRSEPSNKQEGLARFNQMNRTIISMFDSLGLVSDFESSQFRTGLADAVLDATLQNLQPKVPVALIAMGRYGGAELGPGSDLDVIVVHDSEGADAQREAGEIAQSVLRTVGSTSPAYRLYDIDFDLRPEGKQGPMARSVASAAEYYEKWASTWERQALVRARFAGGSSEVATAFFAAIDDYVWGSPLASAELRDIRHLKARMESERIPRSEDPQFHLKLGRGTLSDVEWTVQLLQLMHGVRSPNTLDALGLLREEGFIDATDADVLEESWVFCQRTRNRLALITGANGNSLPTDSTRLAVLARSLNDTASNLREEYLRRTRRCRQVAERLFYGAPI